MEELLLRIAISLSSKRSSKLLPLALKREQPQAGLCVLRSPTTILGSERWSMPFSISPRRSGIFPHGKLDASYRYWYTSLELNSDRSWEPVVENRCWEWWTEWIIALRERRSGGYCSFAWESTLSAKRAVELFDFDLVDLL